MDHKTLNTKNIDTLLKKRIIPVIGEMKGDILEFIPNAILSLLGKNEGVTFFFHSCGGASDFAHRMYDIIQSLPMPTTAIIAKACSAAGIMAQGCQKRLIYESGSILIHSASDTRPLTIHQYLDETFESRKRELVFLKDHTKSIYLRRGGDKITPKVLEEVMRRGDLFQEEVNSTDALKYGFVDKILGYDYKLFEKLKS